MHRLAATPGGWNPDTEGVIFIEQTPAPIVILTAADTDIQTLASAQPRLAEGFPDLRVANLLNLQQQLTIDTYGETVLSQAQVIILRLLGGRAYWSYGLEVVKQMVEQTGASLFVMPGDDRPDPDLLSHSTVSFKAVHQLWRYFTEGGSENVAHALQFASDVALGSHYQPPEPQPVPRVGRYPWSGSVSPVHPRAAILFYRAHYLAGNTAPVDALCAALAERNLNPVPVFVSSLRDPEVQEELLDLLQPKDAPPVQVVLNATSFSIARLDSEELQLGLWQRLDVPVIQTIFSGSTVDQWQQGTQGLSPRDTAMNVALPEVDGRVIGRAVSFKTVQRQHPDLETDVVGYQPEGDRVQFIADLAANWVRLRQTPPEQRRIALILANYPTRDGRLANGVGLDTPASCIEILKAMQSAGYQVGEIPATGDDLIRLLTRSVTNDPEGQDFRPVPQSLSGDDYWRYFETLPEAVQGGVSERWGGPSEEWQGPSDAREAPQRTQNLKLKAQNFPVPGVQLGNVFVGIQPARGYDLDPSLNYHAPDLEPTHAYLAFYQWVRQNFGVQAIAHIGKHGNLEWLPGKSVALSESCYPEVALGPVPHIYPFIVNDPGEGAQAKRRAQAVIIDHLTPPMTRAELYGPLQQLEHLVDEYYEAQSLDPTRLPVIRDRLLHLLRQENLHLDLNLPEDQLRAAIKQKGNLDLTVLNSLDGYLCELKEAQIRDGLHIFGKCPTGTQLRDLMMAIARFPGPGRLGLTRAIAQEWGWEIDPLAQESGSGVGVLDVECRASGIGERESGARSQASGSGVGVSGVGYRASEEEHPPTQTLKLRTQTSPTPAPSQAGNSLTHSPTHSPTHPLTRREAIARLETHAAHLIDTLIHPTHPPNPPAPNPSLKPQTSNLKPQTSPPPTKPEITWIQTTLLPALRQTDQEITNFLRGLAGRYVPSGASGAPTRGRPEVLPTGRNFYSVDIRALPTESAWDVGRKAAAAVIERYAQENGDYPRTLGLSLWGTATMRTGGDDMAEALALLGVQPVWDGPSRRVVDFEILPLSVLGRPRVDVTLRISGFFRDAFPNLIDLFQQAVTAVAALPEPPDQNPLAAKAQQEQQQWQQVGLSEAQATERSLYRVFGSKPGAYGAGLQGLIESQNWTDESDLARAYINWSSYAYTGKGDGKSAPDAFAERLQNLQIVLHNQDNREHDLLDSDDYYQFHGGLTAAVRSLTGQNPTTYFGDHSRPETPRIRSLKEEIAKVYRSRVVNPKWIAGVMRHGYKGAFEMAATVDYLFAYDATARCAEDHMYQGIAQAYVLDPQVQNFVYQSNPWALRDMAERLLEAHQRGLWQQPDANTLEQLRAIALEAEGAIETHTDQR
jgi:cobaltochelatase CobN